MLIYSQPLWLDENRSRTYVNLGFEATPRKGYSYDPCKESDYQLKYLKNVKKRCAQIHRYRSA